MFGSNNPGMFKLDRQKLEKALDKYFKEKSAFESFSIDTACNQNFAAKIKYYINEEEKLIVFTPPLAANEKETSITTPTYSEASNTLASEKKLELNNYHVIIPLIGEGITTQHVTTLYIPPISTSNDEKTSFNGTIFDPKVWNPKIFMDSPNAPNTNRFSSNKIPGIIKGFFWSLIGREKNYNNFNYQTLGTQSYLDSVGCGYQVGGTIIAITELIEEGKIVTRENILQKFKEINPVKRFIGLLNSDKKRINLSWMNYLRKSWGNTFPDKNHRAVDFLFELPKKEERILYFLTLGFLFNPIKNIIKLATEFLLKVLSESMNYLKNRLYELTPTTKAGQFFRSTALLLISILHGIFEIARLLARTITSPTNSFEAGLKIHKSLAIFSTWLSVIGIAAVILFTPVAIAAISKSLFSGLGSIQIIPKIVKPITYVLGNLGFSAGIKTIGSAFVGSILWIGKLFNTIINSRSEKNSIVAKQEEDTYDPIDDIELDGDQNPGAEVTLPNTNFWRRTKKTEGPKEANNLSSQLRNHI